MTCQEQANEGEGGDEPKEGEGEEEDEEPLEEEDEEPLSPGAAVSLG